MRNEKQAERGAKRSGGFIRDDSSWGAGSRADVGFRLFWCGEWDKTALKEPNAGVNSLIPPQSRVLRSGWVNNRRPVLSLQHGCTTVCGESICTMGPYSLITVSLTFDLLFFI